MKVKHRSNRKRTNLVNMKGIRCPRCILSLLGPRPVYRKNGFPCSYRSRMTLNSLKIDNVRVDTTDEAVILLAGERKTSLDGSMDGPYAQLLSQTSPAVRRRSFSYQTG